MLVVVYTFSGTTLSELAIIFSGIQDAKDAHREGASNAIVPAPLMLPKPP
jgi:pleiotropic regulator 1